VLVAALTAAEDHGITLEQASVHLAAGVARYWQQAERAGHPGKIGGGCGAYRRRKPSGCGKLEMVRRTAARSARQKAPATDNWMI
jgi:hypothetical protein